MEKNSLKKPVITTKEFVLYLEEVDYNIFIHCDVNVKWSKSVKNRLNFAFKELRKNLGVDINALHPIEDKKHEKFLKMFGFKKEKSLIGHDNKNYDIYVWR